MEDDMRWANTAIVAGSFVLGIATWSNAAVAAAGPAGEAAVVSGGIGLDEREALAAKARDHNVKLVFALSSGEYLSDVDVEISGAGGRQVVAHRAGGPWMFAKLPPGDYTVRASVDGNTQTRKVSVGKQGQKVVNFLWPASAARGEQAAAVR
jgi:hypothetical protein